MRYRFDDPVIVNAGLVGKGASPYEVGRLLQSVLDQSGNRTFEYTGVIEGALRSGRILSPIEILGTVATGNPLDIKATVQELKLLREQARYEGKRGKAEVKGWEVRSTAFDGDVIAAIVWAAWV